MATGEDGAADATFQLEAERLMETRGGLIEAVDCDRGLLVTQLPKVVAQDQRDGFGGIAIAPVFAADRDAVGK
jgi:hypothetical protein